VSFRLFKIYAVRAGAGTTLEPRVLQVFLICYLRVLFIHFQLFHFIFLHNVIVDVSFGIEDFRLLPCNCVHDSCMVKCRLIQYVFFIVFFIGAPEV